MNWWEGVASKYKAIKHDKEAHPAFSRVIDASRSPFAPYYYNKEFFDDLGELKFPCLIAESMSARFQNQQGDYGDYKGAILVLDEVDENYNHDQSNEAVSKCEGHCSKLIGYLRKYLKDNKGNLGKLLSGSVVIHPIGPVNGVYFGARAEFTIKIQECGFKYDEDDWIDE